MKKKGKWRAPEVQNRPRLLVLDEAHLLDPPAFKVGDIVTCWGDGDEWEVTWTDGFVMNLRCIRVGPPNEFRDVDFIGDEDCTLQRRRDLVRTREEHDALRKKARELMRGEVFEI